MKEPTQREKEAERAYREVIRLRPEHVEARTALGFLLKRQERYEEAEEEFQQALRDKKDFWKALWGLSEVHVEMASRTRDEDLYQDALNEIKRALSLARNPETTGKENFLKMFLLRGYIHTCLGDYGEAKADYEICKYYDEHNLKVQRNLRRVNKQLRERVSLMWIRIPLISVAGIGLIVTCVAHLWFGKFNAEEFTGFASACFAFIILGILLPMITRIKIGKVEVEFEKGRPQAIPSPITKMER